MKFCWFFILSLFLYISAFGQVTKVRGYVKDSITGEALPFVNVTFKNTHTGTITDANGYFFIETRHASDTIMASFVGYRTVYIHISQFAYNDISVYLSPSQLAIDEVVVVPGENPAHKLLRRIIDNKAVNNPENLSNYTYELYNKVQIDINNINEEPGSNRFLKDFDFVFNFVDTSAVTGKTYLPVFILESLSDYYYTRRPKEEKEVIKATRLSGVENESVGQFTGKMYQKLNVYDNFMSVFEPGFVSPIADFGLLYYKYYLIDSAFIDNRWCYQLSYRPKRKMERTFTGNFWVNDTTFALQYIQMRIAEDANINYVNDLVIAQTFKPYNDTLWFIDTETLMVDFNWNDKLTGFFGRKTSVFSDITINESYAEQIKTLKTNTLVMGDAMQKSDDFWMQKRPVTLTQKEKNIYLMVDSIKEVPLYKNIADLTNLLVNYYFVTGLFEIGPYYTFYSFNPIEGNRFRFGGRTSNAFSTRLMLEGYLAYGTLDEKFKYGGGFMYMVSKDPRRAIGFTYENDIQQLGQSENAFLEDNILSSVLRRNPNNKLTPVEEFSLGYMHEWFHGFQNTLTFKHRRIFEGPFVPFEYSEDNDISADLSPVITSEISLKSRFAYQEKFIWGEFERVSLGSRYPILETNITAGVPDVLHSGYSYYKLTASLADKIELNPIGYFKYKMEGGKIWGDLPFPLLELHQGNETYAFDYFAFNMMNYYEFASDRWVSVFAEHHFQGFFLNRIPLIRRLKLREVVSARGLIGSLSPSHADVMAYPELLHSVNTPYMEASVGLENIVKILRVDVMWRLTYLDHQNIQPWGIRAMFQFIL